jgi:hypothetical protein
MITIKNPVTQSDFKIYKRKAFFKYAIIFNLIFSALIITSIYNLIYKDFIFGVICTLIFIIFYALWYFINKKSLFLLWQNNEKDNKDSFNIYDFDTDDIEITFFKDNIETERDFLIYSDIYKIIETKKYLNIYISKFHSYIILKKNIDKNLMHELRIFLKCKLFSRYKVM